MGSIARKTADRGSGLCAAQADIARGHGSGTVEIDRAEQAAGAARPSIDGGVCGEPLEAHLRRARDTDPTRDPADMVVQEAARVVRGQGAGEARAGDRRAARGLEEADQAAGVTMRFSDVAADVDVVDGGIGDGAGQCPRSLDGAAVVAGDVDAAQHQVAEIAIVGDVGKEAAPVVRQLEGEAVDDMPEALQPGHAHARSQRREESEVAVKEVAAAALADVAQAVDRCVGLALDLDGRHVGVAGLRRCAAAVEHRDLAGKAGDAAVGIALGIGLRAEAGGEVDAARAAEGGQGGEPGRAAAGQGQRLRQHEGACGAAASQRVAARREDDVAGAGVADLHLAEPAKEAQRVRGDAKARRVVGPDRDLATGGEGRKRQLRGRLASVDRVGQVQLVVAQRQRVAVGVEAAGVDRAGEQRGCVVQREALRQIEHLQGVAAQSE